MFPDNLFKDCRLPLLQIVILKYLKFMRRLFILLIHLVCVGITRNRSGIEAQFTVDQTSNPVCCYMRLIHKELRKDVRLCPQIGIGLYQTLNLYQQNRLQPNSSALSTQQTCTSGKERNIRKLIERP